MQRKLLPLLALVSLLMMSCASSPAPKAEAAAPEAVAVSAPVEKAAPMPSGPLSIDKFDYAADSLIAAEWVPMNEETHPPLMGNAGEQQVAVFPANFSELKDWRLFWDRKVKLNLLGYDRLIFEAKVEDQEVLSGVILYLQAGDGWYALPSFGLTENWKEVEIWLEQATVEGTPLGLDQVENIRFALLPGTKKDSRVLVKNFKAISGLGLDDIGRISTYPDYAAAVADIKAKAVGHINNADALERLGRAEKIHAELSTLSDLRRPDAQEQIMVARRYMSEAYALVQQVKSDEWRGMWCHYGNGPMKIGGGNKPWRSTLRELASQGYNAIIPNVLWSGIAYYPSEIVPQSAYVDAEGDLMAQIISAAKENNMEVHAWKVMFQFAEGWLAPTNAPDKFKEEGRMQVNSDGDTTTWLSPFMPENVEYEIAAIEELVKKYDVQGLHLDYIRFYGPNVDFSSHARKALEKKIGRAVKNWPKDAIDGPLVEKFNEVRREQITKIMREIYQRVKAIKPDVVVSAAVFGKPDFARDMVFQDWGEWAKEGIVDAVFPMSYTADVEGFKGQIRQHKLALEGTKTKLYVGIGSVVTAWQTLDLDILADEITATREANVDGFAFFEAQEYFMKKDLPFLSAGMTRKDSGKIALPETENLVAMGKPAVGQAGRKLPNQEKLLIADFETGWDKNNLGGIVAHYFDPARVGTKVGSDPWTTHTGAPAELGKHGVVIDGHMGISNPPRHAWTAFCTNFFPDWSPADIRDYRAFRFWVKGDGKKYNMVVRRKAVSDYANFKMVFTAPEEWTQIELPLDQFAQPAWGKQEHKDFKDIPDVCFAPEMQEGQDFRMELDNLELIK